MALALAGAVLLTAGCGDDHGWIEGATLRVAGCGPDGGARDFAPFRMEFNTFGVDPGDGPIYIRAQKEGEPLVGEDGFVIVIQDGAALREWRRANPGAALAFGGPDDPAGTVAGDGPPRARGSLLLARTCPDSYPALVAEGGTLTIESLGTEDGDRVQVQLAGFSIRDMRTDEVVGTGFDGELDFEVRAGKPYRWYQP